MEFTNSDEAWAFWLSYSGQKGFEVKKRYTNKRPCDGKITSCTSTFQDSCTVSTNASPPNDLLINARLKKKDVQTKSSKRKEPHKARKKRENKATSQFGEAGNNDVVHGEEAGSYGAQAQEGLSPLFPEPF